MNWILKFADDTDIFGRVLDDQDISKLQMDLDKLVHWSVEWQIHFKLLLLLLNVFVNAPYVDV